MALVSFAALCCVVTQRFSPQGCCVTTQKKGCERTNIAFATERNGQYIAVCCIFILLSLPGTKYNLAEHSMHGKSLKHVEKHLKPE